MLKRCCIVFLSIAVFVSVYSTLAFADTVYVKDGRIVKGEIVEDTDDFITVFEPESLWKIVIYKSSIDRIESKKHINLNTHTKINKGSNDKEKRIPNIPKKKSP